MTKTSIRSTSLAAALAAAISFATPTASQALPAVQRHGADAPAPNWLVSMLVALSGADRR